MMPKRIIFIFTLAASLLLLGFSACSPTAPGVSPEQQISLTPTLSLAQRQATRTATAAAFEGPVEATPTPLLGEFISDRTPQPTATPGPIMQGIEQLAVRKGFVTTRFLGIRVVDWINLAIAILITLAGYLLGTWLIKRILPRLVKRTVSSFDDELLKEVGSKIRWLVTITILRFAITDRLTFIGEGLNQALRDIFFTLNLSLIVWILWKVFELSADWYTEKQARDGREDLQPVILMGKTFVQILTGIVGFTILLSYFGVNVTSLTAALGIGGLAISLAAKDTVSDAIAGLILLVDQPFRVGDRIEIQGVGTWGDVTEIGLRTTRIRTRDNRLVIVPNSIISNNLVVNYTYPDPRYRIETHVFISFDEDVEKVRQLLISAVEHVEGILADKPVDALFIDMTEGPMKFRLRWWIESYVDTRRMFDRVHTAIKYALDEAGIISPKTIDDINLMIDPLTTENLSRAFQAHQTEDAKPSEHDLPMDIDQASSSESDKWDS
jgi:small-conductance mechanosensitive channel